MAIVLSGGMVLGSMIASRPDVILTPTTFTDVGGNKIYTFTASGSIT
jgi:hypothetical protein